MLVADVLRPSRREWAPLDVIRSSCSHFIESTEGRPLYRNLSASYGDVHRVKVRAKKHTSYVGEVFNKAFRDSYQNISQRAIYAQPHMIHEHQDSVEPFYIFPINGFKFIYSTEVNESSEKFQQVLDVISNSVNNENVASDLVSELLQFSYTSKSLTEGIKAGSEIIIYGIPYFYAVRCSKYPDYSQITLGQQ